MKKITILFLFLVSMINVEANVNTVEFIKDNQRNNQDESIYENTLNFQKSGQKQETLRIVNSNQNDRPFNFYINIDDKSDGLSVFLVSGNDKEVLLDRSFVAVLNPGEEKNLEFIFDVPESKLEEKSFAKLSIHADQEGLTGTISAAKSRPDRNASVLGVSKDSKDQRHFINNGKNLFLFKYSLSFTSLGVLIYTYKKAEH